jgi:hypothetical protein
LLTLPRMHNDRMTRLSSLLGLGLAATLLVTGCSPSEGDDGDASGPATPTGSAGSAGSDSEAPYLPVPDGVELTAPGSQLSVGDHAVVAYHPRQDQVAALDIQVTDLERTGIKDFAAWQLSKQQQESTPYYVRATIENVGDTDLGGREVPLYVVNEENLLLQATPFASSFAACPSAPFPTRFGPGATADVCLVYLAPDHGELVAVSFRPEDTFDPITWTGDVQRYQPPKPDKNDKNDKNDKKKG